MGDIKLGAQVIAKEGQNVSDVIATDPETRDEIKITVTNHKIGERAHIEVRNKFYAETRMPNPGSSANINGVNITHER